MLTPCKPCVCNRASCEQCMFGYKSAETNHKRMKQIIELVDRGETPNGYLLALRYKKYHPNWREQIEYEKGGTE